MCTNYILTRPVIARNEITSFIFLKSVGKNLDINTIKNLHRQTWWTTCTQNNFVRVFRECKLIRNFVSFKYTSEKLENAQNSLRSSARRENTSETTKRVNKSQGNLQLEELLYVVN